ncbi:hypothetical protein CEXT_805981 [Caerostris extrusa]|uniref:Uncharacterized protein n=1 Tax=Caerostris extrusa TaxID=172846 RepID=A0AAV4X676_CAEEX|nr:hypothetical protein CEXT_805981 [Caerostris extrusa]
MISFSSLIPETRGGLYSYPESYRKAENTGTLFSSLFPLMAFSNTSREIFRSNSSSREVVLLRNDCVTYFSFSK